MCPVHRQHGYDRGSCLVFDDTSIYVMSSAEIEHSIHAEELGDTRPESAATERTEAMHCTCTPGDSMSPYFCLVHTPLGSQSARAMRAYASPDLRPEVEALFKRVLGDNISDPAVQQLIAGVVELINAREM